MSKQNILRILTIIFICLSLVQISLSEEYFPSTTIWTVLEKGTNSFFVNNLDIAVTVIYFDMKKRIESISMTIQRQEFLAEDYTTHPNTIYQYFNVTKSGMVDTDIENMIVKFRVEKSWLNNKNVDSETITLYRYSDGWTTQETEKSTQDDTYHYYQAQVSKLDYFLISGKQKKSEIVVITEEEPIVEEELLIEEEKSDKKWIFYIFIFVIVIIGVVFINKDKIFANRFNESPIQTGTNELNDYIKEAKAQGMNYIEIRDNLVKGGWDKKLIDMALEDINLPDELISRLKKYVTSSLTQGRQKMEIKRELMVNGWQEEVIEDIFKDL